MEAKAKVDELTQELNKARRTEDEVTLALRVAAALREELNETREDLTKALERDSETTKALEMAQQAAEEQDEQMEDVKNRCQDMMTEMMAKLREERASRVEVETNLATVADEKNRLQLLLEAERSHKELMSSVGGQPIEEGEAVVDDDRAQARWETQDLVAERDILLKRLEALENNVAQKVQEGIEAGLEEAAAAVAVSEQAAAAAAAAASRRSTDEDANEELKSVNGQLRKRVAELEIELKEVRVRVPSIEELANGDVDIEELANREVEGLDESTRVSSVDVDGEEADGAKATEELEIESLRSQLKNLSHGFAAREQALCNEVTTLQMNAEEMAEAYNMVEQKLMNTKRYCKDAVKSVAQDLCDVLAELEKSPENEAIHVASRAQRSEPGLSVINEEPLEAPSDEHEEEGWGSSG